MTTLAHTGTVAADTIATKTGMRTTLMSLAALAVTIGVTAGIVYSQLSQLHFAPTVAKEPAQQSERRGEAGDHQAASLAASRRATEVYRRLMRLDAWHYSPYLAASLHALSARLGEAGDSVGALAAIDEAIRIRRQLAKYGPGRYLAGLEQSMQLRAQIAVMSHGDGSTMTTAVKSGR